MILIGDVHGKIKQYRKIIANAHQSIQVGDFSILRDDHEWKAKNLPEKHKVNFGNHDHYAYLKHPHSCRDSMYESKFDLLTIRGAYSIDKEFRYEGYSWWENEELDWYDANRVLEHHFLHKPNIIVSHDCPENLS